MPEARFGREADRSSVRFHVMTAVLAVILILVLFVGPGVATALKGHRDLYSVGFLVPLWWVGAVRLARPTSYWAYRFYGPAKLRLAEQRYGDDSEHRSSTRWLPNVEGKALLGAACAALVVLFSVTTALESRELRRAQERRLRRRPQSGERM